MQTKNLQSRRAFLKNIFWAALLLPFLKYCNKKAKTILLKISGTNHILGHRLWAKNFPKVSEILETKYIIVGAGISGLSAARHFRKNSVEDFIVLELESHIGGNSSHGQNEFSKFPLGAHYLPIPNKDDFELIEFLKESKIYLEDDENGLPIFDAYQLTFPKEERLFFRNSWQNDLTPQKGLSENSTTEINHFFSLMNDFKNRKDSQGKYWFDIPIKNSSQTEEAKNFDKITFNQWLSENNFKSEELLWLLDYSCKDDYGLGIKGVSAWAGIHYFAGRKNNWAPHFDSKVFTWPEGNSRLAQHLSLFSNDKLLLNHLVFDVNWNSDVEVLVYDSKTKTSKKIKAEKVLFATPQYVNERLFKNRASKNFQYAPWLLATLTLENEFGGDEELAWDNVIYGAEGLGYIYDQHQNINQNLGKKVITYYRSFSENDTKKSRKKLYHLKDHELKEIVLKDLKIAHPSIEDYITEIQFHKLGHAMISPIPNRIFGNQTLKAKKNVDEKIYFAHSDLSGISIFEEAFHQGIDQAKSMIGI